MRVILVRHAATDGNRHRYVGREDLPLNSIGLAQVRGLAEALATQSMGVILSSPLTRAVDTAQALAAGRAMTPQLRSGLVEIDYGELQGRIKGHAPFRLRRQYVEQPMPGGESLRDVWHRLAPVSEEVGTWLRAGRVPVVVGHYWSNRLLLEQLVGTPFESALDTGIYKPANASACAIECAPVGPAFRLEQMTWLHVPDDELEPGD